MERERDRKHKLMNNNKVDNRNPVVKLIVMYLVEIGQSNLRFRSVDFPKESHNSIRHCH